jgi:hypothetical protein
MSGTVVAPNNATQPTTLQKLETAAKKFGCKGSASDRVWASVKQGAIVGAIRGGASGFAGGEIAEPLSGEIPGAILGGFLGGTMGGSGGVFTGSAIAIGVLARLCRSFAPALGGHGAQRSPTVVCIGSKNGHISVLTKSMENIRNLPERLRGYLTTGMRDARIFRQLTDHL